MSLDLASFALGTVTGALWVIAIAVWLEMRDRKRKRQQAMDEACGELERGAR